MVSIVGDTTGIVTGNPPNVASGDLDATSDGVILSETWSINSSANFGTVSVNPSTGEWTYTVDPAFFDSLDDGEIVSDTFSVRVVGTIQTILGTLPFIETLQITIEIEGVCFAAGTLINARDGPRLIETLAMGDLIETADRGLQPIRWIESNFLPPDRLRTAPSLRPVRIGAGSLGYGLPKQDLLVSQQHRILVRGPKVELLFGETEALVAAKHLCSWPGIDIETSCEPVEYFHILLDQHEILFAEGAMAESLFLGEETLHALSSEGLRELASIFPDKPQSNGPQFGHTARLVLREFEALMLT